MARPNRTTDKNVCPPESIMYHEPAFWAPSPQSFKSWNNPPTELYIVRNSGSLGWERIMKPGAIWSVRAAVAVVLASCVLHGCAEERSNSPSVRERPEIRTPAWHVDTLIFGSRFDADPRPDFANWVDSFNISGVWQAKTGEAFAVGSVWDSGTYRGVIWRQDGAEWKQVYSARIGSALHDVHGSSSTNVWVVGGLIRPTHSKRGVYALHWDGRLWSEALVDSFALGLNRVWARKDGVIACGAGGTIVHYDGVSWIQESQPLGQSVGLTDIWSISDQSSLGSEDLYIAAAPSFRLLHRVDDIWIEEPAPAPESPWSYGYIGVWGQSLTGLYLLNEEGTSGPAAYGTVHRREDTTWAVTGLSWEDGKFSAIRGDEWGTVYVVRWGGVYRLVGDSVVAFDSFPSTAADACVNGLTLMVVGTNGKAGVVVTGTF